MSYDLSIWEGDGLPDYDTWEAMVADFDLTMPEIEGWLEACKREAWVREKVAKYEDRDRNLATARYFWRRVEKLREYAKKLEEQLDNELEEEVRTDG